jgi:anti-anti-sigma factor
VIEVQGDLDIHGAARVLAEVPRYLTAGSRTVLDADGIDFLDSGGLHALIVLARIARTRGVRLSLSNPTPAVLQLIMRTGADEVIDVRTDVEDALES